MAINITVSAQDSIVTYRFKINKDSSQTWGNAYNGDDIVLRDPSYTAVLVYSQGVNGTGDYRLSSTAWDAGMDAKYYITAFASTAYTNILVSSRHKSSSTGPKDFKLQYQVGLAGTWTDLTGGAYSCANDAFVLGTLTNIPLGADANNQPIVGLRWIMTSNTSVGLGTVASGGTSGIDNIIITGTPVGVGIKTNDLNQNISIYPNPSNGNFTITNASEKSVSIEIMDLVGKLVFTTQSAEKFIKLDLADVNKGIYFVRITDPSGNKVVKKLVIK